METYKITNEEQLTNGLINALIERYQVSEVPRLQRLHNYYIGAPDIKKRSMSDNSKPNNKIANPYAAYIVDTVQGYFLGQPIAYQCGDKDLMVRVQSIYDKNHEQAHNSKMGKQLSITGVAYELLYTDEESQVGIALLNPEEVFMVYDNSILQKPIAAVRFYEVEDYANNESITQVEVYKSDVIAYGHIDGEELVITEEKEHFFNAVPVVCYLNNDEAMADFEKVADLIDAYDLAVSDTANNLEYFADAYLVLSGMGGTEASDILEMKENRVMLLEDGGSAQWLVKGTSNVEVEEYKNRLRDDIHTLSNVPSMGDESFGNAASGESLKYKLFGLENTVSIKERNFEQGIEGRTKLITTILNKKGGNYNYTDITMSFTRNIPTNLTTVADIASKLMGVLSHETILTLFPFIDDAQFELDKIAKEKTDTVYDSFFPQDTTVEAE